MTPAGQPRVQAPRPARPGPRSPEMTESFSASSSWHRSRSPSGSELTRRFSLFSSDSFAAAPSKVQARSTLDVLDRRTSPRFLGDPLLSLPGKLSGKVASYAPFPSPGHPWTPGRAAGGGRGGDAPGTGHGGRTLGREAPEARAASSPKPAATETAPLGTAETRVARPAKPRSARGVRTASGPRPSARSAARTRLPPRSTTPGRSGGRSEPVAQADGNPRPPLP